MVSRARHHVRRCPWQLRQKEGVTQGSAFQMNAQVIIVFGAASLMLAACASPSRPQSEIGSCAQCSPTRLSAVFISGGDEASKERIRESVREASTILASKQFQKRCRESAMNRTGAWTIEQVCRRFACAGDGEIRIGLYSDPAMKAVAFEKSGAIFINTAKQRAGQPGNLAHEFAHTLGYSHTTYWGIMRKRSVPYVVGGLVDRLAE